MTCTESLIWLFVPLIHLVKAHFSSYARSHEKGRPLVHLEDSEDKSRVGCFSRFSSSSSARAHAAAGSALNYSFWSLTFEVQFLERDSDELASAVTSVRDPLTVTFGNSRRFWLHIHNVKLLKCFQVLAWD